MSVQPNQSPSGYNPNASTPGFIENLENSASNLYNTATSDAAQAVNSARESISSATEQLSSSVPEILSEPASAVSSYFNSVESEAAPAAVATAAVAAPTVTEPVTRKRRGTRKTYKPKKICNKFKKSKIRDVCPGSPVSAPVPAPVSVPTKTRTRKQTRHHHISPSRHHKVVNELKEFRKRFTKIRHLAKSVLGIVGK